MRDGAPLFSSVLDRYVAAAVLKWSDTGEPLLDIAEAVVRNLRDDWDCSPDIAEFAGSLIPDIVPRMIREEDDLMSRARSTAEAFAPDELAEQLAGAAWGVMQDRTAERALIDQLIAETNLYRNSKDFQDLLDFASRLRTFAPYNAMLLHIQSPSLTHAATTKDWRERFGRRPKPEARPLVVLRTMGPVDFVFDILDTEGRDLPKDAFAFPAAGATSEQELAGLLQRLDRELISVRTFREGDASAGHIRLAKLGAGPKEMNHYGVGINGSHPPPTRFVTLAHELAHLYLGHLGPDRARGVRDRRGLRHAVREIEAESVAYLVARRSGVEPRSQTYLQAFKGDFAELDPYVIMGASGAVERVLGLSGQRRKSG